MVTIDVGKAIGQMVVPAIVGTVCGVAVVIGGNILYSYAKQQGWTQGLMSRAFPGNIIRDAGSHPAYGPHSTPYDEKGYPRFGPGFSFPAYGPHSTPYDEKGYPRFGPAFSFAGGAVDDPDTIDPFNVVGRNSQSRYETGGSYGAPAMSNIDRNYNRVFTDRFPQGLDGPLPQQYH